MIRKISLTIGTIILSLAITACNNKSQTQKKVDSGNAKLKQLQSLNQTLLSEHIVLIPPKGSEDDAEQMTTQSINSMTVESLNTVISQLDQFAKLGQEVLSIIDSGDVYYGGDRQQLADAVTKAQNEAQEARSQRALKNTTGDTGSTTGTTTNSVKQAS